MTPMSVIAALVVVMTTMTMSDVSGVPADYQAQRTALLQEEHNARLGGSGAALNADERVVDRLLMEEKRRLIEGARLNGSDFPVRHNFLNRTARAAMEATRAFRIIRQMPKGPPRLLMEEKRRLIEGARLNGSDFPARHNFLNRTARAAMEATRAFRIIRQMPKGGVLHVHDESMTSINWLVKNVTYRDNCYMCVDSTYKIKFHFFNATPSDPDCVWRRLADMRTEAQDVSAFDETLYNNLTLVTDDPFKTYPDINAVWGKFMQYFVTMEGLLLYAPVFNDYLWEGLRQFREDNVQYVEIRGLLPQVYELNGKVHDPDWVLEQYRQVTNKFVRKYPDFTGVRFIKTALRFEPPKTVLADVKEAMRLYEQNSDFLVGFDMVGQEDPLYPLFSYVNDLLYPSRQNPPVHLPYFFHAGETDWQETATDYNLVDAILLNTTRIGHGYALFKHPVLLERVRRDNIAIEVNPISNQVLKLVDDPRNHPATMLLATNAPMVISSDDPASWEATPLSHDFYVTFMALTGEETGLATLKQLAVNSLRYSAMNATAKSAALTAWQQKWDRFIQDIISQYIMDMDVVAAWTRDSPSLIG